MTRAQKTADTRRHNVESKARIEASKAEMREIVATGSCPLCGGKLHENLSISGWWQCEQLGSEQFRKDPTKPSCPFQGFI